MKKSILWLTESAIMIATGLVLSLIKVIDMPFGGSVSAACMVPVLLVAYRHGIARGLFTGVVFGLVQLLSGLDSLSYAPSMVAAVAIIMFDYILAYTTVGLGGIFKKLFKNQSIALSTAMIFICLLRYLMHVVTGCTVWADTSMPFADNLAFSLSYNAAYMVPETIINTATVWYLSELINFSSPRLSHAKNGKHSPAVTLLRSVSLLSVAVFVVYDSLALFGSIQTEDGFNLAAISNAPLITIAIVTAVCLTISAVCAVIAKRISRK